MPRRWASRSSGHDDGGPGTRFVCRRREADSILSINIKRDLATVVVTLEGLLDEDSSPALAALLWDLVVGQGNLSVTLDAQQLTLSDPVLVWIFKALQREADLKGGSLVLVEGSPPCVPTEQEVTTIALDQQRARRVHAMARAAHPTRGWTAPTDKERSQA